MGPFLNRFASYKKIYKRDFSTQSQIQGVDGDGTDGEEEEEEFKVAAAYPLNSFFSLIDIMVKLL